MQQPVKKFHVKRGDKVIVIAGKDKGKTGKVISIIAEKSRVIVSGVNIVKKHQKPNQKNEKGGIIEKEATIHSSNVLLFSSKLSKGFRVAIKEREGKKVVRFCRKTKEEF